MPMRELLRSRRLSLPQGPAPGPPAHAVRACLLHDGMRVLLPLVLLTGVVLGPAWPVFADGKSETRTLRAATDGWPIHITYFPAKTDEKESEAPDAGVVILLHGKGGDRLVWERKYGTAPHSLAGFLQQKLGLAVVSVDLRKHGESKKDGAGEADTLIHNTDYQQMWQGDLEAVKQFLMQEHQAKKLNINKLAIVAADDMAPIAARFAVADWNKPPYDDAPATSLDERTPRGQDVRALVFLSPSNTAGNINLMASIKQLRDPRAGIAMLVLVGQKDTVHSGTARTIERVMKAADREGARSEFKTFPNVKFSGTDLLGKSSINAENEIVKFLDKHIVKLNSPWRDRRSRLNRN